MNRPVTLHEQRPRVRAGAGQRARGQLQIERIIEAARSILNSEGYGAFTMRNVAERVGISLGTLTYYFKRKEDLFKSMFEVFLARHEVIFVEKRKAFPDDARGCFEAFVETLIEESRDPDTRAFFYQLWAVSVHDPFVESLRKDAYDRFLGDAEMLLKNLHPELPAATVRRKAFALAVIIEGLHVMAGAHSSQLQRHKGYEDEIRRLILGSERQSLAGSGGR